MKTSKVKNVTGNGTYDSQYGLLYKFEYTFEDGQVLNANHKTSDGAFKIGEDVEYEIKGTNDYGSWGKVSKPTEAQNFPQGGFKKQQSSTASFALAYAKDWCIAKDNIGTPQTAENVIATADLFNKWLKENQ